MEGWGFNHCQNYAGSARKNRGSARLGSTKGRLGVGLAVRRFLCAGKYIAPLIEYERGGPQHPAHGGHWRRYVSGDPVHDLASARGHEWLATWVPVQDELSQGILGSSTTCGISGCSVEALHIITIWW